MKFQLPKNILSNNVFKNVLYLVSLALGVSYIINEQSLALISLVAIACGIYLLNKSIVIALFISIIITNLLLSMNYLKEDDLKEGLNEEQDRKGKIRPPKTEAETEVEAETEQKQILPN
jgi:mannitol-specific phosphotransferase system IIBC component